MATRKVTITLDEGDVARVRDLVDAGRAASVSGFVQHAVAVALDDVDGWGAMLAEALDATGGPLTDDVALCLISGGGSALLPLPVAGVSLEDKQAVTKLLHACGAPHVIIGSAHANANRRADRAKRRQQRRRHQ